MFARKVSLHLKSNSVAEFTQRLEKDILPLLRKQKGFQDEITFVGSTGTEAFGISLWDTAENAEAYNRAIVRHLRGTPTPTMRCSEPRTALMRSFGATTTSNEQRRAPPPAVADLASR